MASIVLLGGFQVAGFPFKALLSMGPGCMSASFKLFLHIPPCLMGGLAPPNGTEG